MNVKELQQALSQMDEDAEVAAEVRIPSVFGEQFIFVDFRGWSRDRGWKRINLLGSARIVETPIKEKSFL